MSNKFLMQRTDDINKLSTLTGQKKGEVYLILNENIIYGCMADETTPVRLSDVVFVDTYENLTSLPEYKNNKIYVTKDTNAMYWHDGINLNQLSGGNSNVEFYDNEILLPNSGQSEGKLYVVKQDSRYNNNPSISIYNSTLGSYVVISGSNSSGVSIDDATTSNTKTYSSNKIQAELNNKMPILSTFTEGNIPQIKADGTVEDSGKSVDDLSLPYDKGSFNITYDYEGDKIISETISGSVNRITTFSYGTTGVEQGKIKTQTIVENSKTITQTFTYDSNGKIIGVTQVES